MHLFPEISFENDKFPSGMLNIYSPSFSKCFLVRLWSDPSYRRNFFLKFAEEQEFDPLSAYNWYHVSEDSLLSRMVTIFSKFCADYCLQGAHRILAYHNTFPNAIKDLFTEANIDTSKFSLSMQQFKRGNLFWF